MTSWRHDGALDRTFDNPPRHSDARRRVERALVGDELLQGSSSSGGDFPLPDNLSERNGRAAFLSSFRRSGSNGGNGESNPKRTKVTPT